MISIHLNGETVRCKAATVADLVSDQGWLGKRIAIERNGSIVSKSRYAETKLDEGDILEVVVAVGGG